MLRSIVKQPKRALVFSRPFLSSIADRKWAISQNKNISSKAKDIVGLSKQLKVFTDFKRSITNAGLNDEMSFDPSEIAAMVVSGFARKGIDCVVGGSLAIMLVTEPRMTKDIDFNVSLSSNDPRVGLILEELCIENGWKLGPLMKLKPSSNTLLPEHSTQQAGLVCIHVDGVAVDVFLNDWAPTQYIHDTAREVFFPTSPPVYLKIAPPEAVLFFKLVSLKKGSKRYRKDSLHIVETIRACPGLNITWLKTQLEHYQGKTGFGVLALDSFLEEVKNEVSFVPTQTLIYRLMYYCNNSYTF